ncbi:MAG: LysR substrate-binding domain-containing protein [Pseudomonadota bacterium]
MDPFRALKIIVQIAESGSMRAAGEVLGLSKSVISHEVRKLEESLGVRLLNRSTRSIVLTEAGQLYIERGRHLLNEWRDLEREVSDYHRVPKGKIRIASPPFFGAQFIAPALVDFRHRYPDITVELECDERMVDIVNGRYDLAIRVTILSETQLVRRILAPNRLVLVASPDYLEKRGRPSRPIDLMDHVCLRKDDLWGYWTRWLASLDEDARPDRLDCAITLSSTYALREAAIAGGGVAILHTYVAAEAIARSDLEVILPQHPLTYGSICALFPHRRQMPLKTRVLVDFLVERFRQTPAWEREIIAA